MSASNPGTPPAAGADPSMEDILASIRRILSEDEQAATPPAAPEVLTLQESMIVAEPPEAAPTHPEAPAAPAMLAVIPPPVLQVSAPPPSPAHQPAPEPAPGPLPQAEPGHLVAPEAEAAAASSVGALLRTLVAGREQMHVYRGGPTVEDLVREEIRPLLKAWLDTTLPPIVKRLVRAEIERVVGRAVS